MRCPSSTSLRIRPLHNSTGASKSQAPRWPRWTGTIVHPPSELGVRPVAIGTAVGSGVAVCVDSAVEVAVGGTLGLGDGLAVGSAVDVAVRVHEAVGVGVAVAVKVELADAAGVAVTAGNAF